MHEIYKRKRTFAMANKICKYYPPALQRRRLHGNMLEAFSPQEHIRWLHGLSHITPRWFQVPHLRNKTDPPTVSPSHSRNRYQCSNHKIHTGSQNNISFTNVCKGFKLLTNWITRTSSKYLSYDQLEKRVCPKWLWTTNESRGACVRNGSNLWLTAIRLSAMTKNSN